MPAPYRSPVDESGAPTRGADPGIYARLASQSDRRARQLVPPRGTRTVGIALCLAIAATIAVAADRVPGL